jgi:hypothetical protein
MKGSINDGVDGWNPGSLALVLASRTQRPSSGLFQRRPEQKEKELSLFDIPVELIFKILGNLTRAEVFRLRRVSRLVDGIAFSFAFWKDIVFEQPWKLVHQKRVCYKQRTQPSEEMLLKVFATCSNAVRSVKLHSIENAPLFWAIFSKATRNLKKIHLAGLSPSALRTLFDVLEGCEAMPMVTDLCLLASPTSTDSTNFQPNVATLGTLFPHLTALYLLIHSRLEPSQVETLLSLLPNLLHLSLANCDGLTTAFFSSNPFPSSVTTLSLSHLRGMTDDDLPLLSRNLPDLELISLHFARHLTDSGIAHLGAHPKLEWIKFVGCRGLSLAVGDALGEGGWEAETGCPVVHAFIGKGGLGMGFRRRLVEEV